MTTSFTVVCDLCDWRSEECTTEDEAREEAQDHDIEEHGGSGEIDWEFIQ